ncbi:hypothetical protein GWI33_002687 [Rhynchophorus ferrugineus]|uniref:Uncharacterized protein n=1 Tax=Rhynchophorus ferrugineus TaxID=354439 RepID=A0A834M0R3_RHYFE|nr:hypothetical protein GWI33_002687 [Rhynchophorus ferrugineus]
MRREKKRDRVKQRRGTEREGKNQPCRWARRRGEEEGQEELIRRIKQLRPDLIDSGRTEKRVTNPVESAPR